MSSNALERRIQWLLQKKFWDRIAEKYARQPVRVQNAYQITLDRVATYLKPSDHVLEVGCGTGSTVLTLSGQVASILATDTSTKMIEIARRKAVAAGTSNVTFRKMALDDAATPGEGFAVVMGMNLLHLVEDLDGALASMGDSLRPGGLLITKSVCMGNGAGIWSYVLPVMRFLGKAPFVRIMTMAELENAIVRAGFEIVETGNYPERPPNRFVVAREVGV
ncbi:MAG: methyltransferase domain-containing protein [Litoreibacter sp.]|nr:methyltransferase domain-containing protein [Litoreibacter sp.]